MNKIANSLFSNDASFRRDVESLAKAQFRRRRKSYRAIGINELEDVEQELWLSIFDSDGATKDEFLKIAHDYSEALERRGARLRSAASAAGDIEVPISQLPEDQRHVMENLFYSQGNFDE